MSPDIRFLVGIGLIAVIVAFLPGPSSPPVVLHGYGPLLAVLAVTGAALLWTISLKRR